MERSALFWPEGQRKSVGRRGSIMKAPSIRAVRCAVYTRVSTEYGLDQEFNSLDAQYDAASAYIKSQTHAGWTLIRSRYDDGGYSGGSTDRSPLRRLQRQGIFTGPGAGARPQDLPGALPEMRWQGSAAYEIRVRRK